MCAKVTAPQFWPLRDVERHWDRLILRASIFEKGERVSHQQGPVAGLPPPSELIARYAQSEGLPEGTMMFCGTPSVIGGIRHSLRFELELEDPVMGRKISRAYSMQSLPNAE
jgi:Protein of unknown function (DUF2848)